MSHLIGFANVFYTLWDYQPEEQYSTDANGNHHLTSIKHNYYFIKNISKDLDKAKRLHPDLEIDESLRGKSQSWDFTEKIDYPKHLFPFGKLEGCEIATCNDVWQLERTYDGNDARRRVYARRRLVELGELIRYDWVDRNWKYVNEGQDDEQCVYYDVPKKYIGKDAYRIRLGNEAEAQRKAATTYLHADKEKVELKVKEIKSFGFETDFGYCYILKLESENGGQYTYKGNNPPSISKEEFTPIKATVKHSEYKGEKQTLLQRIKVCIF